MEIEGALLGPDKMAHLLFCIAVTYAGAWFTPRWAWAWWIGSLFIGLGWEASNYWWVITGRTGVSYLDGMAFGLGWMLAGAGLYLTRLHRNKAAGG